MTKPPKPAFQEIPRPHLYSVADLATLQQWQKERKLYNVRELFESNSLLGRACCLLPDTILPANISRTDFGKLLPKHAYTNRTKEDLLSDMNLWTQLYVSNPGLAEICRELKETAIAQALNKALYKTTLVER